MDELEQDLFYNKSVLLLNPKYYSPQNDAFLSFHYFNPQPVWMRCVAVTICAFVIVFGGLGNLTVLAAFVRSFWDKHRHGRSSRDLWQRQYVNIFVLTLADTVICTYSQIIILIEAAAGRWVFSVSFCRVHWAIVSWSYYGGMRLITLVGYDRYLIVKHGVDYKRIETWQKIVTRTLLLAVVEPGFVTIPLQYINYIAHASVLDDSPAARGEPFTCYPENMLMGYIYPGVCFVGFIVPVLTMAYFYWKVYRYTQLLIKTREAERAKNRRPTVITTVVSAVKIVGAPKAKEHARNIVQPENFCSSRHQRATKILKYLFASLAIFYTPFIIATFVVVLIMTGLTPNLDLEWWTYFLAVTQIIGVINNALNPLLYAYTMPKLHETMVNVWKDSTKWALARSGVVGGNFPLENNIPPIIRIRLIPASKTWEKVSDIGNANT